MRQVCCDSMLTVFISVLVMSTPLYVVQIILGSFNVPEWPPLGKSCSLLFVLCLFVIFVLRTGFGFSLQSCLIIANFYVSDTPHACDMLRYRCFSLAIGVYFHFCAKTQLGSEKPSNEFKNMVNANVSKIESN